MLGYIVGKRIGVKVDKCVEEHPQLRGGEHGRSMVENALEPGLTVLLLLFSAALFCFPLLLSPFILDSDFLGSALLFLLVILSLLFVMTLALLGLLFRFSFRSRGHLWSRVCGLCCGCSWIVYRALVVGAYGDSGACAFSVDDDRGLGCFARKY